VFAYGRPLGVVTVFALDDAIAAGRGDAAVGSVMDYMAVPVGPADDAQATLGTVTHAVWDWLRQRSGGT